MAIALDVASESHTGSTGHSGSASYTWNHGGGASARGALVFVFTIASAPVDTSVTYGGVTMTQIPYDARCSSSEPFSVRAYYLDNCGTGTKAVVVNRTNNATVSYAACFTVTNSGELSTLNRTEVYLPGVKTGAGNAATQTAASSTSANTSSSWTGLGTIDDGSPGANSLRFLAVGQGSSNTLSAGTGSTKSVGIDFGLYCIDTYYETTAGQGARGMATASLSDDMASIGLAVREVPPVAGSVTADAIIKRNQSGSATADAVIQRTQTGSFYIGNNDGTGGAALAKTITDQTHRADAVIFRTQSGVAQRFTADAVLRYAHGGPTDPHTFTADAILLRTRSGASQALTADAVVKRTMTTGVVASSTFDSLTVRSFGSYGFYAQAQSFVAVSSPLSSLVYAIKYVGAAPTGSVTVSIETDANGVPSGTTVGTVEVVSGSSLSSDWTIRSAAISIALSPGTTYWIVWLSDTMDNSRYYGVAGGNNAYPYGSSAFKQAGWTQSASDLFFVASSPLAFPADSVIGKTVSGASQTLTADAVLLRAQPGSISADAVLLREQVHSFLIGDAVDPGGAVINMGLQIREFNDKKADAVIFKSWSGAAQTFKADAVFLRPRGGVSDPLSLAADAIVKRTQSGAGKTFALDAVIKRTIAPTLTADAIRKRTMVFGPASAGSYQTVVSDNFSGGNGQWTVYSGTLNVRNGVADGNFEASIGSAYLDQRVTVDGDVVDGSIPSTDSGPMVRVKGAGTSYLFAVGEGKVYRRTSYAITLLASISPYYPSPYLTTYTFEATGSSPTSLTASASSPVNVSDSTAANQGSGSMGLQANNDADQWVWDNFIGQAWIDGVTTDGPGPTVDALIVKTTTGTPSANAVIKRTQVGSTAADADILRSQSGTLAADAVIKRTMAASLAADAVVRRGQAGAFGADAVISRSQSGSALADAVVRKEQTGSLTADAVVRAVGSGSIAADAVLRSTRAATLTTDAIVLRGQAGSASADAQLMLPVAASITADAIVKAEITGSFTTGAWIGGSGVGGFAIDAVLFATIGRTAIADAIVRRAASGSLTADAITLKTQTGSFSASAVIKRAQAGSLVADAIRLRTRSTDPISTLVASDSFPAAGVLEGQNVESGSGSWFEPGSSNWIYQDSGHTYNNNSNGGTSSAIVSGTGDQTADGDTLISIVQRQSTSATGTGAVRRSNTTTSTTQYHLGIVSSGTWELNRRNGGSPTLLASGDRSDLNGKSVRLRLRTVGSKLYARIWDLAGSEPSGWDTSITDASPLAAGYSGFRLTRTFGGLIDWADDYATYAVTADLQAPTIDAVVRASRSGSLTTDAIIKRAATSASTADAVVRVTTAGSLTAAAIVKRSATAAFLTDAVLASSRFSSVTADAVSLATRANTFAADAIVIARRTSGYTADAWLYLPTTEGSAKADAIIRQPQQGSLSAAAWVQGAGVFAFAADAVLKASRATSASADAVLRIDRSATFSASAITSAVALRTLRADAIILKTAPAQLTAQSVLRAPRTVGVTASAVILSPRAVGFTASAAITGSRSASFPAQAVVSRPTAGSFTAAAYLIISSASTIRADAVIHASRAESFAAAAVITTATGNSFAAEAVLRRERTDLLTAAAHLSRSSSITFTAGAVTKRTASASFSAAATIAIRHPKRILADISAATIAATVSASTIAATLIHQRVFVATLGIALESSTGSFSAAAVIV